LNIRVSDIGFLTLWGAARVSAPQQIIMQSPSEPEFLRTADDLTTLERVEQEVYADVRLRAAYTRYRIHNGGSNRKHLKHLHYLR